MRRFNSVGEGGRGTNDARSRNNTLSKTLDEFPGVAIGADQNLFGSHCAAICRYVPSAGGFVNSSRGTSLKNRSTVAHGNPGQFTHITQGLQISTSWIDPAADVEVRPRGLARLVAVVNLNGDAAIRPTRCSRAHTRHRLGRQQRAETSRCAQHRSSADAFL